MQLGCLAQLCAGRDGIADHQQVQLLFTLFGVLGALILGLGMCFFMVWENIVLGTLIGLVGLVMLLALIPMTKGLK